MIIILGAFNARVLLDPGLPTQVGTNIFRSERPLGTHSEEVLDNRDRFLDILLQQDLVALNALHMEPPETQVTNHLQKPGTTDIRTPMDQR